MEIFFSVNRLGLEGLGTTLTSLIRNCTDTNKLTMKFLCNLLLEKDKKNIGDLLLAENYKGDFTFIDFNANNTFHILKSLHGDKTTYGRLLIPNYAEDERVVYLDADLIINCDILELNKVELTDNILAAVYGCTVEWTLDKYFFENKLHLSKDTKYFNAGVLIFNMLKWKDAGLKNRLQALITNFHDDIDTVDQTLLNALCAGKFDLLPAMYNIHWGANVKPDSINKDGIIHFIGSPKPWDYYYGNKIHTGYNVWIKYINKDWQKIYGSISFKKLIRLWNIKFSIYKHIRMKIFEKKLMKYSLK